ncbi:phage tail tape measure protein [Muribaculaceae bacterium Z1]|nr:phage tail tape measure protein [Muribaculaceae bacterium S4]NBI20827.1 phage tail tape measure protein [Muribaculaceae bacterium Z1]
MSNYNFNYAFNISGNCNAVVAEISGGVENLQRNLRATTSLWDTFEGKILAFNQITQYVQNLGQAMNDTLAPGAALESQLAELEAIAGVTAEEYATLERYARSSAKEFGVSAAGAVDSYKLLLSQLSPELTKNSEALNNMGNNVAILSKMMKGDATAAAEVLTTAMNQYGVSLDDPMAASDRMWEMMNTMAAAAREGSAELPAIKVALEQCGMAAKAAGVSFEETNAAIQVLDKAGKKGSEGGVALRNVMSTLAQGRFLPKDVREELAAAGISVNDLTDKSKSLAERLQVLKPVMADDALFSKLFGKENSAAAMALVQGVPKVQQWTEAITGTTTAIDQADIVMATYNERLARVQARFDDFKISIFNCCGDLGIWTQVVLGALTPLAQLVPLIWGAAKAVIFLRSVNFKGAFTGVVSSVRNVCAGLVLMNASITASGGYWLAFKVLAQNVCRSIGVAIMNIPIVGWIAAAIAAVIAIIQQLWDKCKGFRVAVFTAWEGIKALFSLLWEWLSGLWQRITEFAVGVWNAIKSMAQKVANIFMAVVNKIRSWIAAIRNFVVKVVNAVVAKVSAMCKPLVTAFKNVANAIKGFFGKIIDWVRDKFYALINWFIDKYNWIAEKLDFDKIARLGREAADRSWAADHPEQPTDNSGGGDDDADPVGNGGGLGGGSPIGNALGGVGGGASKETDRVKNINITIDRLIDKFTITTTNLSESKERIKDAVAEALLSAVNDANYAL